MQVISPLISRRPGLKMDPRRGRVLNFRCCVGVPVLKLLRRDCIRYFSLYFNYHDGEAGGDCPVGSGDHPHIDGLSDDRV